MTLIMSNGPLAAKPPSEGTASYYTLRVGDAFIPDAGWFYPAPLEDAQKVGGHICFSANGIELEVDGRRIE